MKKKPPPASSGESAPMWVVSFADLVALLMAFFVMLSAFSAGSSEDVQYRKLLRSLQEAFGYISAADGPLPADAEDLIRKLEQAAMRNFKDKKGTGDATQEGMTGRDNTVTRVREGVEFTIGGQLGFDPESAVLKENAREALAELAEHIRGENNKIEVRGHSTASEAGKGKAFTDVYQLSYARASAVAAALIEMGIRHERIRRVDCGSSEPLVLRAYDDETKAVNRRVEIIVTQALVHQFEGDEASAETRIESPVPPAGESRQASARTTVARRRGLENAHD